MSKLIRQNQLTTYDRAAADIGRTLEIMAAINVGRLDAEDVAELNQCHTALVMLRSKLFGLAYARFLHDRGLTSDASVE